MEEIKTKKFKAVMNNLKVQKALVVLDDNNEMCIYPQETFRMLRQLLTSTINVYDILKYDTLVVTKDAVATIEEVYA